MLLFCLVWKVIVHDKVLNGRNGFWKMYSNIRVLSYAPSKIRSKVRVNCSKLPSQCPH